MGFNLRRESDFIPKKPVLVNEYPDELCINYTEHDGIKYPYMEEMRVRINDYLRSHNVNNRI